jgi:beta-N-acetylhexosaminidase
VSYTDAAVAALNAGCDLVLLCNQSVPNAVGGGLAVDELIAGLTEAQVKGRWHASDASEQRRQALLPTTPSAEWDALMVQPSYMQAMDWVL